MIMILDVDVTAERRHYNTHRPKGDSFPYGPSVPSRRRRVPTEKALCYRAESFFCLRYLWDIGPGGVAYDGKVKVGQKG